MKNTNDHTQIYGFLDIVVHHDYSQIALKLVLKSHKFFYQAQASPSALLENCSVLFLTYLFCFNRVHYIKKLVFCQCPSPRLQTLVNQNYPRIYSGIIFSYFRKEQPEKWNTFPCAMREPIPVPSYCFNLVGRR